MAVSELSLTDLERRSPGRTGFVSDEPRNNHRRLGLPGATMLLSVRPRGWLKG